MFKTLRGSYFNQATWVKARRADMGADVFDKMYRSLYAFLSTLHVGQYFFVGNLCKKDPANYSLVVGMCEIYNNMDFFVNLDYEHETGKITILPPYCGKLSGWSGSEGYHPPDVYSQITKNPKLWGVDPADL